MEDLHISARATHLQKEPQDLPEILSQGPFSASIVIANLGAPWGVTYIQILFFNCQPQGRGLTTTSSLEWDLKR